MNPLQPSVGRTVHYVSYGTPGGEYKSQCRAAIITAVDHMISSLETDDDTDKLYVDLCVLNPEGFFFNKNVRYSEENLGGTWHWPERV